MNYTIKKENAYVTIVDNGVDDHSEIVIPRSISSRIGLIRYHTKNSYIRPIKSHLSFRIIKLIIIYDGAENSLICDVNSYHRNTTQFMVIGNPIKRLTFVCDQLINQLEITNKITECIHLENVKVKNLIVNTAERLYLKPTTSFLYIKGTVNFLINPILEYTRICMDIHGISPNVGFNIQQSSMSNFKSGAIYGDLLISPTGIFPLYLDQKPSTFNPIQLLVEVV